MLPTPSAVPPLWAKSLLIFDDGLASKDGHWFEIDKSLARFHSARGTRVTIVSNVIFSDSDELTALGVRVLPLIEQSLWTGWLPERGRLARLAVRLPLANAALEWIGNLKQARHFRAILKRALGEQSYDCVLHPTALMADFLTWCLMPRAVRQRVGRVVFSTWYPIATYHEDRPPSFARKLVLWKFIAWKLRKEFASGRMKFVTDSRRIADEYRSASGLDAVVAGTPRSIAISAASPKSPAHNLTFGSLGAARWEKGIDVFQSAIASLVTNDDADHLRFVIQWNRPVARPDGSIYLRDPLVAAAPQIDWWDQVLSSQDYDRILGEIDCMVLPYRRLMYQSRSSAVAVEAACSGIPMIYTADSWLSDFVAEQGAGIAVADGDVDALARAILTMAADYPDFKAKAVERSAIARERNSPEQFARLLWGATVDGAQAGAVA
jgi:glycosyltransferase involved in cell wall biosynthesis